MNRHFTKEDTWMTNTPRKDVQHQKSLEKCNIKITVRYHNTCTRMTKIKKTNKYWKGCRETGPLTQC